MKKRTEAFSVLLSATFVFYFWGGEKVDFFPHFFGFLLHVYLIEHPEIQDGHRYLGKAAGKKMALISIGIDFFLDQCLPMSPNFLGESIMFPLINCSSKA